MRQVGGACTSAQLRNITLCSQLNEVHRSLMNLLLRLPAQAAANLRSAPDPPLITTLSIPELSEICWSWAHTELTSTQPQILLLDGSLHDSAIS